VAVDEEKRLAIPSSVWDFLEDGFEHVVELVSISKRLKVAHEFLSVFFLVCCGQIGF